MQIKNQQGTAIFTALFVVAIVSAIVGALVVQQRIEIMRTQQVITSSQAEAYARGVLYWAMGAIIETQERESEEESNENQEDSDELWPQELPSTPIAKGRGFVSGSLEKYSEKFNINSLSEVGDNEEFESYLNEHDTGLNLSSEELSELAKKIGAWVTLKEQLSEEVQNTGNVGEVYLSYVPAYRIANRNMLSISELRLIDGVTSEIYQQLAPHIAAYPFEKKAVKDKKGAAKEDAKEVKNKPEEREKLSEASQQATGQNSSSGDYYLLRATVKLDKQQLVVYYLLTRTAENNRPGVKILWQSLGTL